MIGRAIRNILINYEEVASFTNKVYPVLAPQGQSAPFIVYRKTRKDPQETKNNTGDLIEQGIEIQCVSKSYDQAEAMSQAVNDAIMEINGLLRNIEGFGVRLTGVIYENNEDFFDESYEAFNIIQEFTIDYNKL